MNNLKENMVMWLMKTFQVISFSYIIRFMSYKLVKHKEIDELFQYF